MPLIHFCDKEFSTVGTLASLFMPAVFHPKYLLNFYILFKMKAHLQIFLACGSFIICHFLESIRYSPPPEQLCLLSFSSISHNMFIFCRLVLTRLLQVIIKNFFQD